MRSNAAAQHYATSYVAALNSAATALSGDVLRLAGWGQDSCSGCNALAEKITTMRKNEWRADGPLYRLGTTRVVSATDRDVVIEAASVQDVSIIDKSGGKVHLPRDTARLRLTVHWTGQRWIMKEVDTVGSQR